jgi:23S rRNA pseudouridine955/2504/2580 synthase
MDIEKFILFSNEDYFVINKSPGIAVLENRNLEDNWLAIARRTHENARVCHRIDVETSGVLVFSRHDAAYRHLSMAFQERNVRKVYHALVHGVPAFTDKEVNFPILISGSGKVKVCRHNGKPSETLFRVLERLKDFTLLECMPITGRRHQIRVHSQTLGHPIVADSMYGGRPLMLSSFKRRYTPSDGPERPLIARPALHAYSIAFEGLRGEPVAVQAPYPKDFRIAIDQLRKEKSR